MLRIILNSGIPSDIIPQEAITYDEKRHVIEIDLKQAKLPMKTQPTVWMPPIPATGSMKPSFGAGNNNILLYPRGLADQKLLCDWLEREIKAGKDNVVVYAINIRSAIIHRAIKVSHDRYGRYFKFRGDKNLRADRHKVRDYHIQAISIGTIY